MSKGIEQRVSLALFLMCSRPMSRTLSLALFQFEYPFVYILIKSVQIFLSVGASRGTGIGGTTIVTKIRGRWGRGTGSRDEIRSSWEVFTRKERKWPRVFGTGSVFPDRGTVPSTPNLVTMGTTPSWSYFSIEPLILRGIFKAWICGVCSLN